MKKVRNISLGLWLIMTAFYFLYVGMVNHLGTGEQLAALQNRAKQLELENALLENQIASASALRHISVKAAELGFKAPEKILYIK